MASVIVYYTTDYLIVFVSSVCFHISSYSSVPMDKIFRRDSDLTCLQKLLECLRKTLSKVTNCFIAEEFLTQIENLFLSNYKSKQENEVAEDTAKQLLM